MAESNGYTPELKRIEEIMEIRKAICPKELLQDNAAIYAQYFRPKDTKGQSTKWTEVETKLLIDGIHEYGIGQWNWIRSEYLKNWEERGLKLRAMKLLGTQNIQDYKGWKGGAKEIEQEKEKNVARAKKEGTFKYGVELSREYGDLLEEKA